MTADATSRFKKPRVRVNVTCEGILIALTEQGAVVQLPTAQTPQRQTTLAIEGNGGETLHLPARVVRSVRMAQHTSARAEHYVAVEFLELPRGTAAAVRRIIDCNNWRLRVRGPAADGSVPGDCAKFKLA